MKKSNTQLESALKSRLIHILVLDGSYTYSADIIRSIARLIGNHFPNRHYSSEIKTARDDYGEASQLNRIRENSY